MTALGRAIVLKGDARHLPLPDSSVDLICTSPPYWAQRSYQDAGQHYAGQIGSESTPWEYLDNLIACTREWMRVLKPSGSIWVNLADKYSTAGGHTDNTASTRLQGRPNLRKQGRADRSTTTHGLPTKSLLGLPWRYAIRCTDELGLILRRDQIWRKPSAMPESVTDRCKSSHEYWFHLTKQPRYFAAIDELRLPVSGFHRPPGANRSTPPGQRRRAMADTVNPLGPLPGSVWEIPTTPFAPPTNLAVEHYASFPPEWPRRLILGWSPAGICTACNTGRRPVAAAVGLNMSRPQARRADELARRAGLGEDHFAALVAVGVSDTGRGAATQTGTGKNTAEVYELAAEARAALGGYAREYLLRRPTRYDYVCDCPAPDAPTRRAVVLDPFGGTGTTAMVARALGRTGISVDLSTDYCRIARWRTNDRAQLAKVLDKPAPPPEPDGMDALFDLEAPA